MRRPLAALALSSLLALACRNEDIAPPDVYFDPNGRGQLPDGSVITDASTNDASTNDAGTDARADVSTTDVSATDVSAADAGDADVSITDVSDADVGDAATD